MLDIPVLGVVRCYLNVLTEKGRVEVVLEIFNFLISSKLNILRRT